MEALCEQTQKSKESTAKTKRILFVCTGNTCRSPMAEAVANDLAMQEGAFLPDLAKEGFVPRWEAFSAGLSAVPGEQIAENAVLALENAGVTAIPGHDYHGRVCRPVSETFAQTCDLIVGMSQTHAMELFFRFPSLSARIVTMPEPIPDPYGQNAEIYQKTLASITDGVKKLLFSEATRA